MSADFCDWEPCSWLQKYILGIMPKDRKADTIQGDMVQYPSKLNGRVVQVRRVTFHYCPFCGTRIFENKEILEWVDKKRGLPA